MAAKSATRNPGSARDAAYTWDGITNADTANELEWAGGEGYIDVHGTPGGATVQFQFGSVSGDLDNLSTEEAPVGAKFTDTGGLIKFDLPKGFLKPTFSGGGGTQDIDIVVTQKRK